uniref:Aminopeptidase n=1 Tax=Acrobeloides nanus TaxID=290746 RepID=A0A914E5I1_9BILA
MMKPAENLFIQEPSQSDASVRVRKPGETKSGRVICSLNNLLVLLFVFVVILLAAVLFTFLLSKYHFERIAETEKAQLKNNNQPISSDESQDNSEEIISETSHGPTAAELRLSKALIPLWYNLTIKIYVPGFVEIPKEKNLTFDGALTIKFRVDEPTNKIELNSLKLGLPSVLSDYAILEDSLVALHRRQTDDANRTKPKTKTSSEAINDSGEKLPPRGPSGVKVVKMIQNETLEKAMFELSDTLKKDQEYYFQFVYKGTIDTNLAGLYLTQYADKNGAQRYAAVTQMQPNYARRMVPCFDEPEFKAVWRLKIIHPVGSSAVSNAKEILENEETEHLDWIYTTFEESLPMSSYLLALCVSDFGFVEGNTKRGTRVRIWSRKEAINETVYALEGGKKVLEFYEDYYNITFPLSKQDMMAFPDLALGAMENWGLVTYREKYLLYNSKVYAPSQKQAAAVLVAHELAHQWFGNLVTMKWWDDLWLNEGFATLMEYRGTDAISDGAFRMEEYFVYDSQGEAFGRDARATSHPLAFPIENAEDVNEVFDAITYDKGGSVLRMIRSIMGEEYFQKGLTTYLNKYRYSNADHTDLWNTLSEAVPEGLKDWNGSKFNVDEFAKPWTEQMGFPVVYVRRVDKNRIELSQKRFKIDEDAKEQLKDRNSKWGYKWDVPLWYSVNGEEKPMKWLHETTQFVIPENDVVVFNVGSRGFYRVNYEQDMWKQIAAQLMKNHTKITSETRARLLDDAFTLAQAGQLDYETALSLTGYLDKETEYLPWAIALERVKVIQDYFDDEPEADALKDYLLPLITKPFKKIDWEHLDTSYLNDSRFFENLLDAELIDKMCSLRDENCIEKVTELYRDSFVYPCQIRNAQSSQCSVVPVPLRALTYCYGVKYGKEKDFDRMFEFFMKESIQVERDRLMSALACTRDTHAVKKLLVMAANMNSDVVRLQDKPSVFFKLTLTPIGGPIVFEFFLDHWSELYNGLKDQLTILIRFIHVSISGKTQRHIDELEHFLVTNRNTTRNLDAFKQRLEILKTNKNWMDNNFKPLAQWFKAQAEQRRTEEL